MRRLISILSVAVLIIAWMTAANLTLEFFDHQNVLGVKAQSEEDASEDEPRVLDDERIAKGRLLFEKTAGNVGCAACHGNFATGDLMIAPNVRGVDEVRIDGALDAAEEMEFLIAFLSRDDIIAMADYLIYLDQFTAVEVSQRRGAYEPETVIVPANAEVQLIVNNGNRSDCTFTFDGVELEPKVIDGRDATDFLYTSPEAGFTFIGFCKEDAENTVTFSVEELEATEESE